MTYFSTSMFLASWGGDFLQVPLPVTIACTCIFSYGLGRYGLKWWRSLQDESLQNQQDASSAEDVVGRLHQLAESIGKDFKNHQKKFASFENKVASLLETGDQTQSSSLAAEAKKILDSCNAVSSEVAQAFSKIHDQIENLTVVTDFQDDALTGMQNRKTVQRALRRMFAMRDRYGYTFSLLAVTVDPRNDDEGPVDESNEREVMRSLAVIIGQTVRDTDLVARWETGQFIVLLPYATIRAAEMFGDRLRQKVDAELPVTVSIGVVDAAGAEDPLALPQRCLEAQQAAQAEGPNQVHVYEDLFPARELESSESVDDQSTVADPAVVVEV
ncbi:MAG: GGDEF domain-containing protein [Pirellulales bacterium]|nr:GGDEF domain-containing protein [Pirellulales bacterium]